MTISRLARRVATLQQRAQPLSRPHGGETRAEKLRMDLVCLADELRDQEVPGEVRRALEVIRHWR